MIRKTKIVCTLGPASDNDDMVSRLMDEGMNVCRLNMSHGSYEEQAERIQRIKRLREEKGIPVGILLDTKGPEVRTKTLAAGKVELEAGQEFVLTSREVEGNDNHTFTGDKAPDKHTGEKVWTKTETQHEQKWNCCEITTVSLENHQWENGVCTECNYICVHADTDTISTNPQTGDNIIMSIIIFALALIGILGIFIMI